MFFWKLGKPVSSMIDKWIKTYQNAHLDSSDSLLTPVYKWQHPSSCAANIPQMIIRPFQVDRKKTTFDNFLTFVLGQTPPCCFLMMEMWVCVFSCSKEPSWSRCCPLPSYPIPWAVSYGIVCMFTDTNALNLPYWNLNMVNMHCLAYMGYRNRMNAYALWLWNGFILKPGGETDGITNQIGLFGWLSCGFLTISIYFTPCPRPTLGACTFGAPVLPAANTPRACSGRV